MTSQPLSRKAQASLITGFHSLLSLLILGCFEKPLSPVAPTWDVKLDLPLMNRTYSVNQILEKDTTLFHRDPSGLLVYSNSQSFTPVSIQENLKIDGATGTYESRIGRFSVKAPPSKVRRFTAVELNSSFGDQQGEAVTVPSISFSLSRQSFPLISEFQQATLASGQATLTFTNRLPIPVDNISVAVESQNGVVIHFTQSTMIQPNDSVVRMFSLADLTLGNALTLSLSGHFPPNGVPVKIDSSSAVYVRLDFSDDIEASHAIAKLPSNTFTTTRSFSLDDSTRLDLAAISSGSLTLTLNNSLGIAGQASLSILGLRRPDGSPFVQLIEFAQGQQNTRVVVPLNGYSVSAPGGRLDYSMTTQTYDTGNDFVTIDSSMMISGSVSTTPLYFQSVQGTLKPSSVDVSVSRTFDLSDANRIFSGTAKFSQARLNLTFSTQARCSFDLNAALTARNRTTGQTATLTLPPDQRRISYPQTTITLSESNSNIIAFLNSFSDKLPDEFTLAGNAVLNPTYTSGSVSSADLLGIELSLDIPLQVGIISGIARDTTSVNISTSTRKDIDQTNYGKISFEVQNGLPAAVQVAIDLLDFQRNKLLTLPKSSQPLLAIAAGQIDSQGRVVVPASSTISVELLSDDVKKFQTMQYAALSMTIQTSGGGGVPVQFRTTDEVKVRAYSTLNYRVSFK